MEALGILKFWRSVVAGADVSSEGEDVRNAAAFGTDDDETDDEDSFFDLVFRSPDRGAAVKGGDAASKKDLQFIESQKDVFLTKNDFSNSKPLSPVTILRSAPKFKVFMLGFIKSSKCEKTESNGEMKASPVSQFSKSSKLGQSNRFSGKCRVADMPAGPVFARDNSLRSKMLKENCDYETSSDVSSEKSVPKYLKLIKPFYVKASKKTKLTDSLTPSSSPVTAPVNLSPRKFSEGSRVGSFKIVTRNLGKSRSASAAVGVPPPSIRRRDDSLLEQHDGIQGAILHCKRSYNSSSQEFSQLFRSASDPLYEKQRIAGRNSCEEQKRCSI
ncbi:hypothetical protein CDL12_05629 [Handroanthus impetiginosus]|uniref:Membrane-associated kinase regulator 2 n=1 Tax=Handroanthus impetiginosus TaxID=429701 RepID=A0A2G9HVX7_9LAMI|nr:hypothetical protein CDL12_05629 [Handroanthus impetiginosus]